MNPLPLIRAALLRHYFSALAFVFLVAAGVSLSVAVVSQERALRKGSTLAADRFDLIVAPPGSRIDALLSGVFLRPSSSQLLTPAQSAALLNDSRAVSVSPLAFGDSFGGAPVVGVTAALVEHLSDGLAAGRLFTARNEAVVGFGSNLKLGDKFQPTHGIHHGGHRVSDSDSDLHDAHSVTITVVGRMKPTGSPWDRAVTIPIEQVWLMHHLPTGHDPAAQHLGPPFDAAYTPGIPMAVLQVGDLGAAYKLRSAYNTKESMAFFPAETLVQLYQLVGDIRQLMSLLALVTQALLLLSIMASVLILFRLLMPQFVTLRAIGAPRSYLFAFAWGFTSLLVGLGVLLGLAGGYALSFIVSTWLSQQIGVSLQPALGAHELLMALSIFAVGLLLASLPAWHLQRLSLASVIKLN
jgi:putative ABC transport system permease protein